jgi:prevent-host-death family protein
MAGNVVGARELKVRLGRYLRRVRQGHRLIVTDRGQPVAELRPIGGEAGIDSALAELEARGVVVRPSRKRLTSFRLIESRGSELSTAVVEDRDDRS